LKTIFDIPGSSGGDYKVILLEIGEDHVNYAFLDKENNSIGKMMYFEFQEADLHSSIDVLLDEFSRAGIEKIVVCSAFPHSVLMPSQQKAEAGSLIGAIYEHSPDVVLKDDIPEWQVSNEYGIPVEIHERIWNDFPGVKYIHTYTCALRSYNGVDAPEQIAIHFSPRRFRVIVKKQGKLQLAQVYFYQTPLDVVYYLLKISSELELDQNYTHLVLSGLIEEDSAMYRQLHSFYTNLEFAAPSDLAMPDHGLPGHYFYSLNTLASCAS
jgi:hypothetical protein